MLRQGVPGSLSARQDLLSVELAAAITAGGRVDGELARRMGTDIKALAPVGGRRIIDASIDAARGVGATHITVVGPPEVHAYCGDRIDVAASEHPTGEGNLRAALASAGDAALLLLTSDIPFVDPDALAAFVEAARDCDVAMPLASAADYEAAFPGAPPHLVELCGERVANGSAFYFQAGAPMRVAGVATQLFSARKSLLRMAALLGPALLLRFAFGRLRIGHVEGRAQRVFGLCARAIRNSSPALAYDVDTLEDYEYARQRLATG